MATQAEREQPAAEKSRSEKSRDAIFRVEQRFQLGSQDAGKAEVDRASREPGAADAEKDLTAKLQEMTQTEMALKDLLRPGGYQELSVPEKAAFHGALEKAKFYAMHASAEPARIEDIQDRWEGAVEDLRKTTEKQMRTRDALSGQTTKFDERSLQSDEAIKLREYVRDAQNLEPSDKTRIVAELQKSIDELIRAEAPMQALADTKKLPPAERDRRIAEYNASATAYNKRREDLRELVDRVRDYASS